MHNGRPSDRELDTRLNEAKKFLKDRPGMFANPSKTVGELNDLAVGRNYSKGLQRIKTSTKVI